MESSCPFPFFETFNRQQEKLEKMINASGYKEKVPSHIQDENVEKLTKLFQEMEFFKKESERLEAEKNTKL
jgi:valyl-tRNA synthetase